MSKPNEIRAARDIIEPWLTTQPGVVGTSVGLGADGEPCLRIFVKQLSATTRTAILKRLGSIPVDFEDRADFIPYVR